MAKKRFSSKRSKRHKDRIWKERNGQVHCCWCTKKLSRQNCSLEHVIPRGRGGSWAKSNLDISCYQCNHDHGKILSYELLIEQIERDKLRKLIYYFNIFHWFLVMVKLYDRPRFDFSYKKSVELFDKAVNGIDEVERMLEKRKKKYEQDNASNKISKYTASRGKA